MTWAGKIGRPLSRHVIGRHLIPHFLSSLACYDVSSSIRRTLQSGWRDVATVDAAGDDGESNADAAAGEGSVRGVARAGWGCRGGGDR
jgi:hypothetical protein